jgi:transposase
VANNFWLTDEQFAALAPHLPMVDTGPERQDEPRIISGIIHRFRAGCRWRALPEEYGPYTTVFKILVPRGRLLVLDNLIRILCYATSTPRTRRSI